MSQEECTNDFLITQHFFLHGLMNGCKYVDVECRYLINMCTWIAFTRILSVYIKSCVYAESPVFAGHPWFNLPE